MNEKLIDVYDYVNNKNELVVLTIIYKNNEYIIEKCRCINNKVSLLFRIKCKKYNEAKKIFEDNKIAS